MPIMDNNTLRALGADVAYRPIGYTTEWRQRMQKDGGGRRWPYRYALAPLPELHIEDATCPN